MQQNIQDCQELNTPDDHLCPTSEEALTSGALARMSSVNFVLVQVWQLSSTNLTFRSGRYQVRAGHQIDDHTLCTMQGSLTRPDLKREMKYLEKLLYKNRNQHRESQHFRRLQEASLSWQTHATCMPMKTYIY